MSLGVFAFRDAIEARRPESEVKSLGNELYQILIGPVAKNIESYQPKTLVWSLDDVLRYVPMAALYDGSHYLTESHANVVINLASLINLKDKPSSEWTALGLGVSETRLHSNGRKTGVSQRYGDRSTYVPQEALPNATREVFGSATFWR